MIRVLAAILLVASFDSHESAFGGLMLAQDSGRTAGPARTGRTAGGIAYDVQGSGPPVILLAGSNLDRRMWNHEAAWLSKTHTVVRFDMRAHGQSESATVPFSMVGDLLGVMDDLKMPKATLIGLSAGSTIALDAALEVPDRVERIVLAGPAPSGYVPPKPPPFFGDLFAALKAGEFRRIPDILLATPVFAAPPEYQPLVRQMVTENDRMWTMRRELMLAPKPAMNRLESVRVPTLVLVGEKDEFHHEPADLLAKRIPGAQMVRVKGGGHLLNLTSPAEFQAAVAAFLSRQPTRAPMRLLIADDQPDVLEALRLLLHPQGFRVTPVTTPAAVVDHVRNAEWDAVLMDLNYQRGTTSGDEGLDLLTALRSERPDLPIVVMTAWGDIDLAVRAMRAGAQSFVEKPWDNRKLVQILEREIAAGRGARERSERHGREQRDALLIQRALIPATLPSTPRFEVAGAWQPAGTLGGDCYDVFLFGPDALGVSIADVAGKGLPAALLMSSLQAAVRAFAHADSSPQALCASVNRLLCGQMIAGRFVTLAYVRLDAARGTIAFANAGHNPPLLARSTGEVEQLPPSGTVLGVFADTEYQGAELPLRSGDRLLLYTDGISEARDPADQEFGEERLRELLVRHRHLSAGELHAAMMAEIMQFATAGFQDDATLLVIAVA